MQDSDNSTVVSMQVSFASFFDEKLSPDNLKAIVKGSKSFAVTTGGFPHELVLSTVASSANVSHILIRLFDAKHITVERQMGNGFELLEDRVLEKTPENGVQEVEMILDPQDNGKQLRELRLRILSGYSEFVGIYPILVIGEESQQMVAVLEKNAEVNI